MCGTLLPPLFTHVYTPRVCPTCLPHACSPKTLPPPQFFISAYTLILFMNFQFRAAMPASIKAKHTFSSHQLATLSLSFEMTVKLICHMCTFVAAIFLLANMSSQQTLTPKNKAVFFLVGAVGFFTAFVETVHTFLGIRMDIKRSAHATTHPSATNLVADAKEVTSLSWFYPVLSFVITLFHVTSWLYYAVFLDKSPALIVQIFLPFNVFIFIVSFGSKPRRHDRNYLTFLYFHLFLALPASFVAAAVGNAREKNYLAMAINLSLVPCFTAFTRRFLHVRENVAQLPTPELSEFLTTTLLSTTFKLIGPVLFLSFKPLECLIMTDFDIVNPECRNTINACSECDTSVQPFSHRCHSLTPPSTVYLLFFFAPLLAIKVLHDSVPLTKRDPAKAWTLQKIAVLDVSSLDLTVLTLLLLSTVFIMLLFSLLLSGAAGTSSATFIDVIGFTGTLPLAVIGFIEDKRAKSQAAGEVFSNSAWVVVCSKVRKKPRGGKQRASEFSCVCYFSNAGSDRSCGKQSKFALLAALLPLL